MGNVHPYPRYLSREPSRHSHPTPMKKYGLLYTHLGCKSAIKGTVHLLLCDAEMLLTHGSIKLVSPAKKPFPCLPCWNPQPAILTQHKKIHFRRGGESPQVDLSSFTFLPLLRAIGHINRTYLNLDFGQTNCSPHPAQPVLPSPHHRFPLSSSEVWFMCALKAEPFLHWTVRASFSLRDIMWLISRWGGRNRTVTRQSV